MKRILFFLLSFSFLFILGSCGKTPTQEQTQSPQPTLNETPVTPTQTEQPITPTPENNGLCVYMPEGRGLKVLQLADIHFGIEGKDWHNDKVDRTKEYINTLINEEKPDLIVCSGDNILGTGTNGLNQFIEMMESYKIPWTWVYGNHDAENFNKASMSEMLVKTNTEYLLYEHGYMEPGKENRFGNFSIKIYNASKDRLLGAFIILDSGEHDYSLSEYQAITPGQIDWYKNEIDSLQEIYAAQENNEYEIIPTVVYTHIQLPEYKTAYERAKAKEEDAEFVIEQTLSSSDITELGTGGPKKNTGFFDVLVEKGSTKAYFVGHAHTFNFQVKYEGIIFGFAPQTGFSKLFANNDAPRKTYMYNIDSDLTFTTSRLDEIVRNKGLIYTGTSSGSAKYNESAGTYSFTVQLPLWGRVSLDYYGPELSSEYKKLTLENTTVTGEITYDLSADWSSKLYCTAVDSGLYLCSSSLNYIYRFTYTVATDTLHIELVGELDMESGKITAIKANRDSEISLWKKAGAVIISDSSYATAEGKRLFIIVDKEGRIAFSCYNHSTTYGNPLAEEKKYYCHPYYDNNDNPAIILTDSGYKIVIPEGGFAITADGDGIVKLAKLFINPSISSKTGLEAIVNKKDAYNDGLRLSYDGDTKVITSTFE